MCVWWLIDDCGVNQALVISNTSVVTLEVVLTVQQLVRKFGAEQDSLTWDLILDIAAALITSTQVSTAHTCTCTLWFHRSSILELIQIVLDSRKRESLEMITQRHSIAEWGVFSAASFCLFVDLFVIMITSERLNIGWWNLAVKCIVQKSRPSPNLGS